MLALRTQPLRRAGALHRARLARVFPVWAAWLVPAFGQAARGSADLHYAQWGGSPLGVLAVLVHEPGRVFAHFAATERLRYPLLVISVFAGLHCLRRGSCSWRCRRLRSTAERVSDREHVVFALFDAGGSRAGIRRGRGRCRDAQPARRGARWFGPGALLLASVLGSALLGGLPWSRDYARADFRADAATANRRAVLALIGANARCKRRTRCCRIWRSGRWCSARRHRTALPSWVVLDVTHRQRFARREDLLRTLEEPIVRTWLARDDYGVVFANRELLVLHRGRRRAPD